MIAPSFWRGHAIVDKNGLWLYSDNNQKVSDNIGRLCKFCGKKLTKEGHDGCVGVLDGVMNACCGHGNSDDAYVQFLGGNIISGIGALKEIKRRRTTSEKNKKRNRLSL